MASDLHDSPQDDQAASPAPRSRPPLGHDLDVDVCVIGAGVAGLTAAREAARLGASVALLESREVGGGASAHHLGTILPGFRLSASDLIARVGIADARGIWALSREGVDYVRAAAAEAQVPVTPAGLLEASNVDIGDQLIGQLQLLGGEFGLDVEGWQVERVRASLGTGRYFHGIHFPSSFQVDARQYLDGLAALAEQAGARIFQETPLVALDASGIRKRITTPLAKLRADHVVLATGASPGDAMQRLASTLLPVWRYGAVTAPLGERLAETVRFKGAVIDSDGVDHFRIVEGDRLMWSSPETTWAARPEQMAGAIRRRIRTVLPALGPVAIAETFGAAVGETVHGMPQVGALRPGLWIAGGFGRHGLANASMAGQLIARSMLLGDDRARLFAPFELVWAGGNTGRAVGYLVSLWSRRSAAVAGAFARSRERARARTQAREARRLAANARVRPTSPPE